MEFSTDGIDELAQAAQHDLARAQDRARLLVRALRYAADEDARGRAGEALVEIGAPAVTPLVEFLTDDQVSRGGAAQQVLTRIGAAAVEPLIELLGHPDSGVRASVAWMFTGIIDSRACPALAACLEDEDAAVRQCAAYALGDQHCFWAVPRLLELLDDLPYRLAAQCQRAMDGEEMHFEQLRLDTDLAGQFWDDGVARLLAESSSEPVATHEGEQSGAMDDDEDYVGAAAAYALGTIGDPRAVDRLIEVAQDEQRDWLVRGQAVWALGEIGDERAFPVVLAALDDPECEPEALAALGGFEDDKALDIFARYYRHPLSYIRQQVVLGLRRHGGPETVPYLLALLHDRDPVVRGFAARSLGWVGDQRAIEPLLYSLRYGDERFRTTVLEALEELSDG
jgi:HEAT repeat protein